MTYGIKTFDAGGNVILDVSDKTMRLVVVPNVNVPSSGNVTVNIAGVSLATTIGFALSAAALTINTGNIVVTGSTLSAGVTTLLVYQFGIGE